ncbi:MAG: glycoside hydrolase family 130 protein [Chloroflexi bacterium]|nr:glycoside hydrolase family 130 protein [Chloroflexota bacterium]
MDPIPVTRTEARFLPDPRRVITRPFLPGDQVFPNGQSRVELIIERVLSMPEEEAAATLVATLALFADRHIDLPRALDESFRAVAQHVPSPEDLSAERRQLIGAYFTNEYSIEAASLSNPSMVAAPDQSGLQPGEQRFVMSLRAIGEGHLSSIELRAGVIDAHGTVTLEQPSGYAATGAPSAPVYEKRRLMATLADFGALNEVAERIIEPLREQFTREELDVAIATLDQLGVSRSISFETVRIIHRLASSNYELTFPEESPISERVIFPTGPSESQGMEDARFVRFTRDDGSVVYYGTYTAYDGFQIIPQLIETADFVTFRIATLTGNFVRNKGMAFFPRTIDGRYVALSRHDNESNYLMLSDDVRHWSESERIQAPTRPWELRQIGNCGSPLETEAGWLVITHGVGPMRQYTLGALLLDIADPCRVIGHLKEPLLVPSAEEREGYVPNVLYSCGSMIHGDLLVLPYAFSDFGARIATVPLDDLLTRLTAS